MSGEQGKEVYMGAVGIPEVHEDRSIKLTRRELEVLSLVIEGKSSKDVADALYVSKRTVDFHLANIYDKLQVSNRVQAFRRATRLGLIPLEVMLSGN
ncbi:MAG: response regulator transcription factor [Armatimonadetes bacterium]|nr:response regulator transcription factor [Armatimonadota bacterium]